MKEYYKATIALGFLLAITSHGKAAEIEIAEAEATVLESPQVREARAQLYNAEDTIETLLGAHPWLETSDGKSLTPSKNVVFTEYKAAQDLVTDYTAMLEQAERGELEVEPLLPSADTEESLQDEIAELEEQLEAKKSWRGQLLEDTPGLRDFVGQVEAPRASGTNAPITPAPLRISYAEYQETEGLILAILRDISGKRAALATSLRASA